MSSSNIEDEEKSEEIKQTALEACQRLLNIEFLLSPPGGRPCNARITNIENFQTQTVAGTNYFLDLTAKWDGNCGNREFVCQGMTVFEPLPFQCDQDCLESTREDEVQLIEIFAEEGGCGGCLSEATIDDQENASELKREGVEACKRLLINEFGLCPPGSRNCQASLRQVDNFQTQVVAGTNYIMDLTLELNGQEYQCTEITLYEPLSGGLESIRESDVNVLELSVPEPIGCPGCAFQQSLEDQENALELKREGVEACKRLLINEFGLCPPGSRKCQASLRQVDNFQTQVVAGTNYIMDLTLELNGREYQCTEITLYEPLAGGYESIRESDVNVLDLSVPEPIGCPGCAFQSEQSLEDLDNGEQLINEGLLACQRLLKNQFGLSFRCDLSFENVDNFRTQVTFFNSV